MGSPFLTYLASNISRGGPSWFYYLQPCVSWSAASSFQTTRASGDIVSLLVHTWKLGGCHIVWVSVPDLVQPEEADPRARPAIGLDVDSPGATRICSLLVKGIMSFRISWD